MGTPLATWHPALLLVCTLVAGACGGGEPRGDASAAPLPAVAAPAPADRTPGAPAVEVVEAEAEAAWYPAVTVDGGTDAAGRAAYLAAVQAYNLPRWVFARAAGDGHAAQLEPVRTLNPFYQAGDFDGDGRQDVAVLVRHRESGETGILLVHGGATASALFGAGRDFGNGGTDFEWMTNWRVLPGSPGAGEPDALEVIRLESAGGIIRRIGGEYRWRQAGD